MPFAGLQSVHEYNINNGHTMYMYVEHNIINFTGLSGSVNGVKL